MEPPINGQSSIKALRVLELYAGIGGMHCALDRCFSFSSVDSVKSIVYDDFEVVAAIDVNEVAAAVYRHNFPATEYLLKGVEGLTLADLEALNVDLVTDEAIRKTETPWCSCEVDGLTKSCHSSSQHARQLKKCCLRRCRQSKKCCLRYG